MYIRSYATHATFLCPPNPIKRLSRRKKGPWYLIHATNAVAFSIIQTRNFAFMQNLPSSINYRTRLHLFKRPACCRFPFLPALMLVGVGYAYLQGKKYQLKKEANIQQSKWNWQMVFKCDNESENKKKQQHTNRTFLCVLTANK